MSNLTDEQIMEAWGRTAVVDDATGFVRPLLKGLPDNERLIIKPVRIERWEVVDLENRVRSRHDTQIAAQHALSKFCLNDQEALGLRLVHLVEPEE